MSNKHQGGGNRPPAQQPPAKTAAPIIPDPPKPELPAISVPTAPGMDLQAIMEKRTRDLAEQAAAAPPAVPPPPPLVVPMMGTAAAPAPAPLVMGAAGPQQGTKLAELPTVATAPTKAGVVVTSDPTGHRMFRRPKVSTTTHTSDIAANALANTGRRVAIVPLEVTPAKPRHGW